MRFIAFFLLLLCGPSSIAKATGYSPTLLYVLEQLRHSTSTAYFSGESKQPVAFIGGSSVGLRGAPGEFFLLIPYFRERASEGDVVLMLNDKSPVVKIMAAYLILGGDKQFEQISVDSLNNDQTPLAVAPGGCIIANITVAELVQSFRRNPDYFGERGYNQRLAEKSAIAAQPGKPPRLNEVADFPKEFQPAVQAVITAVTKEGMKPAEYFAEISRPDSNLHFHLVHQSHDPDPSWRGDSCGKCCVVIYDPKSQRVMRVMGIR